MQAEWPFGEVDLEARFEGSEREAWLGLLIRAPASRLSLVRRRRERGR